MPLAPLFRQHPGANRHRRFVSDMLPMPTGQIGHPIAILVLMELHDRLFHLCMLDLGLNRRPNRNPAHASMLPA